MKDISGLTIDDIQRIPFERHPVRDEPTIQGVIRKHLTAHVDGRGDVIELWSAPWMETEGFSMPKHVYQSATDHGVVKSWHLHAVHTDQFAVTRGKLQVVCADVRENSPSYGHVNSFVMGVQRPTLLLIPPGVMHGWKALSQPETIVVNLQTEIYDSSDEFRFPWDCVLTDVWEPQNG
jgi:dTDP-4-dehydrorhamnose 3,5-epimerase